MLSESDLHDALLLSYVARRVGAETVHDHHRVHGHDAGTLPEKSKLLCTGTMQYLEQGNNCTRDLLA